MHQQLVDHAAARILVVDDEPLSLVLARSVIEQGGYRAVATTDDPVRALGICRDEPIDLVLLDFNMPGMSGMDVLVALKEMGLQRAPAVIMVTGVEDNQVRRLALEKGADDFIRKPFDPHELQARVRNTVALRLMTRLLMAENEVLAERVGERDQRIGEAVTLLRKAELEITRRVQPAAPDAARALREPLLTVLGYADVLAGEAFGRLGDARYKDYAARMRDDLRQALGLLGVETEPVA